MKAFRVGYILALSFLLVMAAAFMTTGFHPAPKGPKAPTYPTYPGTTMEISPPSVLPVAPSVAPAPYVYPTPYVNPAQTKYQQDVEKYSTDQKQYQEDQKAFVQGQIIPYLRDVYVAWIVMLVVAIALGLTFAKKGMELVGGALAFTGVWAVIFGPFWAFFFFASSTLSTLSRSSDQALSPEPITKALGLVCLAGSVVLIVSGMLYERGLFYFIPKPSSPRS